MGICAGALEATFGPSQRLRRCARSHFEATLKSLWHTKALHRCARSHLGASKAPPRCARSHLGVSDPLPMCSRSHCARSTTLSGCVRSHSVRSKTLHRWKWKHCAGAFEVTVQSYCSRSLFEVSVSVSRHLETLHPAPLPSEHGYICVRSQVLTAPPPGEGYPLGSGFPTEIDDDFSKESLLRSSSREIPLWRSPGGRIPYSKQSFPQGIHMPHSVLDENIMKTIGSPNRFICRGSGGCS